MTADYKSRVPSWLNKDPKIEEAKRHASYVARTSAVLSKEDGGFPQMTATLPPSIRRYRKHLMEDAAIIERIASGETITKILKEPDMPSLGMVARWRERNLYNFGDRYERAVRMRTDVITDQILDIADDTDDPRKARVQMDARKWLAAKTIPEKWGDRTIVSGDRLNPISLSISVDLSELSDQELAALEAFAAARQEAIQDAARPTIETSYEDLSQTPSEPSA